MSSNYNRGNPTKTERCTDSFRTSSPEYYTKIKQIDLSTAMFFLPKKTGNYFKTYEEKERKYRDCNLKKNYEKCKDINTDAKNAEKEFKRSLSNQIKSKTVNQISNIKTTEDLQSVACYIKLLNNLCGNNSSSSSAYISAIKNKIIEVINKSSDKNKYPNYVNDIKFYVESLLSNNDVSKNEIFKKLHKMYRQFFIEAINNYGTC